MDKGNTGTLEGCTGVFGGTFDPIHNGHLALAELAQNHFGLRRIIFVPAWKNPFRMKMKEGASPDDRLEMVRLAISDNPSLEVDSFEILSGKRNGRPSFTIQTLQHLKNKYPGETLVLLVGADNVSFHNWYRIDEYDNYLSAIVIMSRPKYENPMRIELEMVRQNIPEIMRIVEYLPLLDEPVSATAIRESLAKGIIPEDSLHPGVQEYIRTNSLYGYTGGT